MATTTHETSSCNKIFCCFLSVPGEAQLAVLTSHWQVQSFVPCKLHGTYLFVFSMGFDMCNVHFIVCVPVGAP